MGSGGTEWETADLFDPIRLNQKTRFVGTETQLTNLITSPQAGQTAFTTTDGATYKREKIVRRNAANSSWSNNVVETTTGSIGELGTTTIVLNTNTHKVFCQWVTLPSTEKFYVITGIEAKFGAPVDYLVGADVVLAVDPPSTSSTLAALGFITTGQNSVAVTVTAGFSRVLRGGTVLVPWVTSNGNGSVRGIDTGSGVSDYYNNDDTWDNLIATPYGRTYAITTRTTVNESSMVIHYKGYS